VFDEQFADDRPDGSAFLAELRLALSDDADLLVDGPAAGLLDQPLLVDHPSMSDHSSDDVVGSRPEVLALAGVKAGSGGGVSVTNRHDRRLASFGWLMLSVVAPARMAHRHRRGRPRR
jgi:hypothetical protein